MASPVRYARVSLLTIALVAAAGAASVRAPKSNRGFGCWGFWVAASANEAIRPFLGRAVADLVAGGELHDAAEKGDLAAVKVRLCSQATSVPRP